MRRRSLARVAALPCALLLAGCATPAPPVPPAEPAPAARRPGRVDVVLLAERASATEAVVRVEVEVEPGWRVYGLTSEYGVPPRLELELPEGVLLDGPLEEPPAAPDLALGELPITAHRGRVTFVQRLGLETTAAVAIPATFTWQVCDEDDTFCSPGRAEATLVLAGAHAGESGLAWWDLGSSERVSVRATLERDGDRTLLRVEVVGRGDWTVHEHGVALDHVPPGVEAEPGSQALRVPAEAAGRPIAFTVRWRARTWAGTPGRGEVRACLPLPPP